MTPPRDPNDGTYKPYAGFGSPRTPEAAVWVMRHLATKLALSGWTLRGGGGVGPDAAFLDGAADAAPGMPTDPHTRRRIAPRVELYTGKQAADLRAHPSDSEPYADYVALATAARDAHPDWKKCDDAAQLRHLSGLFRLFGPYPVSVPVPVHFAVFWHDGKGDGGQLLRYAERWNRGEYRLWGAPDANSDRDDWKIDLRNLYDPPVLERALVRLGIAPEDYKKQWRLGDDYLPTGAPGGIWPVADKAPPGAPVEPGQAPPVVYLLGHGGDPQPALLKRLTANRITQVVDARPDPYAEDANAPWADGAELEGHLTLQGLTYRQDVDLRAPEEDAQERGARVLASYAWANPDEVIALLDRAGSPDHQTQLNALLPRLRGHGLVPVRIRRDGTTAPA